MGIVLIHRMIRGHHRYIQIFRYNAAKHPYSEFGVYVNHIQMHVFDFIPGTEMIRS